MKSYQRILLFLLVVLFFTALLSPWAAVLWDRFFDAYPQWEKYRFPFSRIFDRTYMALGIILFFAYRPLLRIESMNQMGLQSIRLGYPDLVNGVLLGLASWIILIVAMSSLDVFSPNFTYSLQVSIGRFLTALLSGAAVGILEEIFFRGIIFKGLLEDWKKPFAFVSASLFYSAVHFIKPAKKYFLTDLEPLAGARHVVDSFHHFLDPVSLFPGFFGLFLLGMILSYAFFRTGSLYLSIGIHGGLVFGRQTLNLFGNYDDKDLDWLFGESEPRFMSGVATWMVVLFVGFAVYRITRKRAWLQ
ncbi:MAG: CPBP family intramembrane metalloprotease [Deltaproteobacteria bacterium]|nr:CPBP family intramembrane metalloprotease [Deltaproteobacteria bacterium]